MSKEETNIQYTIQFQKEVPFLLFLESQRLNVAELGNIGTQVSIIRIFI